MNDLDISAVVAELSPLVGRRFGKVFQLSPESYAIDFGMHGKGYLFVSVEPALPRFYLINRRLRDLEKRSMPDGQFSLSLKKELSQAELLSIEKDEGERIVRLKFMALDELNQKSERTLILQLTGRAANMHVPGKDGVIMAQARPGRGAGQQIGERYERPPKPRGKMEESLPVELNADKLTSVSEALDAHYTELVAEQVLIRRLGPLAQNCESKSLNCKKLLTKLTADLASHADPEAHKRIGDLLLANTSSARRTGNQVTLIDYFADDAPQIEIEVDEKLSLPEAASRRFAQYSRSKRALQQIDKRIDLARAELAKLEQQQNHLERVIADRDAAALETLFSESTSQANVAAGARTAGRKSKRIPGVRQYRSTDGFDILVGRASQDNDNLTFKIARPNDLWLHAADYPGSHVIVHNSTRKDLPHRTLIEAAQLAAYFSQANKDPKVDVHYTPRKFVSKPRGAAPGLVRLSRQKSITVEPHEAGTRINI